MSIFKEIIKFDDKSYEISGLTQELKAIYVLDAFYSNDKNILVVCNSLYEANTFYSTLNNYIDSVLLFPMDDFLTSQALAISPELVSTRLETLTQLVLNNKYIVVTNLMGYLRFLPDINVYKNSSITLKIGDEYDIATLEHDLFRIGYKPTTVVSKTGEMAIRGFVLDIFPVHDSNPIRVEFWGDSIESIRIFDVNNQLSIKNIKNIIINPYTEFLIEQDIDTFELKQSDIIKYTGKFSIRNYLNDCYTFFDNYNDLENSYNTLLNEITEYNISERVSQSTVYMNDFYDLLDNRDYKFLTFDNGTQNKYGCKIISDNINNNLKEFFKIYLKKYDKVIVCLSNRYKVNKIFDMIDNDILVFTNENQIFNNKVNLIIKNINQGFIYNNIIILSEKEVFNIKDNNNVYRTNFKLGTKIRDINKLEKGDYVVHRVHGIGVYQGIKTLVKNGYKKDYLFIAYKDEDKLYIPVEKIDLINKYSGKDGFVPKINKLGSAEWTKIKLKAQKRAQDIASDLLKLYALRESSVGYAFSKDMDEQIKFESQFEYAATPDQLKVIDEIKKDMEKLKPMDRLLCGDVGYGKTEVAFRAMFKAIMDHKQVAFLCPTTILSSQHYKNAVKRFEDFAINIALLNRFVPKHKMNDYIDGIKNGNIDIVIGTHRLLSDDIVFKDLGLLVIDEEQRFGVRHKEKIRKYKNNVDVLTLSATPIPRTLQMSMSGLRSLSLIETPPVNRYPVQTYVLSYNNQIIKDAIYKELSRNGQTFILCNRIDEMNMVISEIMKLVPEATVAIAHGRMSRDQLENVMYKFTNKEFDILICTTIIETGIDIPSVNTLIILDADHFGLSQLYQIRGRVGRSDKIAYCYLMYDKHKILSEIAIKRLNAIKEFTELGSGFAIAMRDLSIRGAGDILGSEQAGFIDAVGIEMFTELLNNEIKQLKGEEVEELSDVQPLLDVETAIDDNYVSDEVLKIEIHKKINEINSYDRLLLIKKELEDRFGSISETMLVYMYEEWFEKEARNLKITQVRQTKTFIEIKIPKSITEKIDGQKLFLQISSLSRMFRFSMVNNQLAIILDIVKLDKHFIYYLVELIQIINDSVD